MSNNRARAAADLLGLESLGWIDNLTRAVAVEISTFTPGSNTFSTLTLVPPPRPGTCASVLRVCTGDRNAAGWQCGSVVVHVHVSTLPLHNNF